MYDIRLPQPFVDSSVLGDRNLLSLDGLDIGRHPSAQLSAWFKNSGFGVTLSAQNKPSLTDD